MSSLNDVYDRIRAADAAGDSAKVAELTKLAVYLADPKQGNFQAGPASTTPIITDPAGQGGTLSVGPFDTGIQTSPGVDNFLSGVGQAFSNLGQGAGQMLGLANRGDVAESRKLDTTLDATTAGKAGNLVGNVAAMIPTALIPGGQSLAGATAAGALTGLLQPSTSTGETLANTGIGAAGGPVALGVGRGIQALGNYGSSFVAPLFQSGRDAIIGRTLNHFAGSTADAQAAADAMKSAVPALSNVAPTMGMTSGNAGLAQLQRTLQNNPDLTTAFSTRQQQNVNGITSALQNIAGTDADRTAAVGARQGAAAQMYGAAYPQPVAIDDSLKGLLQRPAAQDAIAEASKIAKNDGWTLNTENPTVKDLHYIKLALDDMVQPNAASAIGRNASGAITNTKNALLSAIDSASPDYANARQTFATMSGPINRMDVGTTLFQKLSPALNDVRDAKVLKSDAFATALRDADATAQKATGFDGATMAGVLTPGDLAAVQGVKGTLGQISDAQTLGKAVGSPTAQNLIAQDAVRQFAGPLGLPQSFTENELLRRLMTPQQMVGKWAEPRLMQQLGGAALNPSDAAELMLQQLTKTDDPRLRNYLARALLVGSRGSVDSARQ